MKEEDKNTCCKEMKHKGAHYHGAGGSGAIYGLGVIGALFYFLKGAAGAGAILLGIGKAFFWPALLVFRLLEYLRM